MLYCMQKYKASNNHMKYELIDFPVMWLPLCRLVAKPGCKEIVFWQIFLKFRFYIINEAHNKYSFLAATFNFIFYVGPPGTHLWQNQENLSRYVVGFWDLSIDVFLEVQDKNIYLHIVLNNLFCLWVSFVVYNLHTVHYFYYIINSACNSCCNP